MMKKPFLWLTLGALLMSWGLYRLPKTLVSNKAKTLEQANPRSTPSQPTTETQHEHAAPLTGPVKQQVEELKTQIGQNKGANLGGLFDQLTTVFIKAMRYDSAGFYAEKWASQQPSEANYFKAGGLYYEAYTFADGTKAAQMGEKTRQMYGKVLEINPNNAVAKSNMAMTYTSTAEPMKGIMLLREVIGQDPNNELALYNLGQLSMRSNQFDKAVVRFRQILNNNPNNEQAQLLLGVSLAELDKKDEARKTLEQLLSKTTNPDMQRAVKEVMGKL
jgi:tetratricopeptide (TPR) repeat protein